MARPSSALRGKVAVVAGSTRGVGLRLAAALAQAGARIVLVGPSMAEVEATYAQVAAIPGVEVLGVACDPRRLDEVEALGEQAVARFGALDIWVNHAPFVGPLARLGDAPADEVAPWIGFLGALHGTQVALRHMLPRNQGKIISLLGAGAREREPLPRYVAAYGAAQAGALRLAQTVAAEVRHTGLSVLSLATGRLLSDPEEPPRPLAPDMATQVRTLTAPDLEALSELVVRLAGRETDGVTGRLYDLDAGSSLRRLFRQGP